MTITADSAASNGRVRASSDTQPAALTPPLVVPLQAPGARSGARARAGSRAGAAGGRARSEPAPRGPDARLMVLQRRLWSVLSDHYFRRKRGQAVLAGRRGFVRQAITSGVPIVAVATVGGHVTVFVLQRGVCGRAGRGVWVGVCVA